MMGVASIPQADLTRGVKGDNNELKIVSQHVDTLKLHVYSTETTKTDIYNSFVSELKELKEKAQSIQNDNNDLRFVIKNINNNKFKVMAQTVTGFSVSMKNDDITVHFKKQGKRLDQPIIKVEYRSSFLVRMGVDNCNHEVKKILDFIVDDRLLKVSEIHITTDIQGHEFTMLDYYRFRGRSKNKEAINESIFRYGRAFTGFIVGSGDNMLRIYNKTKEITKNPDKGFIKKIWTQNNYDPNKTVWRIEQQLRKAFLDVLISKDGLFNSFDNVLDNIGSLWSLALKQNEYVDFDSNEVIEIMTSTTKNGKKLTYEAIKKRYQRAGLNSLWEFIQSWKSKHYNKADRYTNIPSSSFQWVYNSVKSLFSTILKHYGTISKKTLNDAFFNSNKKSLHDKNLGLIDDAYQKGLDYFNMVEYEIKNNGHVVQMNEYIKNGLELHIFNLIQNIFATDEQKKLLNKAMKYGLVSSRDFTETIFYETDLNIA